MENDPGLLSFDIEISDVFDLGDYEDIELYAPFNVAVAATAIHGGEERVWYSEAADRRPALNLTKKRARELLEYLGEMQQAGFGICAWNGLGFDFKWLGRQAEDYPLAARIALESYDPMFQFFNQAGFPVGLEKVARGMGIPQEKLLAGADAPKKWRAGEHKLVMDYCLGDCQMTNAVIAAIRKESKIRWVTARGSLSSKPFHRLQTVKEVIRSPPPDQSWMSNPIPREKFYLWAREALGSTK